MEKVIDKANDSAIKSTKRIVQKSHSMFTGAFALSTLALLGSAQALGAGEVTFHKDIEPILQRSCQNCHRPGGAGPMSLVTYEEVAPFADRAVLGPFARLRPGTQLGSDTKVGNFVETKKAIVGPGSKINHLSYVGDAELGANVNIGAGTITCNYDGVNKFKTEIGDNSFVGSNSTLIAPLSIGVDGFIAAGSTVNSEVPAGHLAVARSKQRNISGWKRPTKK